MSLKDEPPDQDSHHQRPKAPLQSRDHLEEKKEEAVTWAAQRWAGPGLPTEVKSLITFLRTTTADCGSLHVYLYLEDRPEANMDAQAHDPVSTVASSQIIDQPEAVTCQEKF